MTQITPSDALIRAACGIMTMIMAIAMQQAAAADDQALLSTHASAAVMEATDRFNDALRAEIAIVIQPQTLPRRSNANASLDMQDVDTDVQVIAADTPARLTDSGSKSSRHVTNP